MRLVSLREKRWEQCCGKELVEVFFAGVVGSVKEYICESFIWVVEGEFDGYIVFVSVVCPWGVEHDGMCVLAFGESTIVCV